MEKTMNERATAPIESVHIEATNLLNVGGEILLLVNRGTPNEVSLRLSTVDASVLNQAMIQEARELLMRRCWRSPDGDLYEPASVCPVCSVGRPSIIDIENYKAMVRRFAAVTHEDRLAVLHAIEGGKSGFSSVLDGG